MLASSACVLAASAWAQAPSAPKYATKVPPSIETPDKVETRIGALKFSDGLPDDETVQKVCDNLDFARGVETFLRLYAPLQPWFDMSWKPGDFELVNAFHVVRQQDHSLARHQ